MNETEILARRLNRGITNLQTFILAPLTLLGFLVIAGMAGGAAGGLAHSNAVGWVVGVTTLLVMLLRSLRTRPSSPARELHDPSVAPVFGLDDRLPPVAPLPGRQPLQFGQGPSRELPR